MFTASKLRQTYFDFFIARGHQLIPSAPLVPENDPTVLFTTAGMHPLVPYLLGQPHPKGKRLVDVQKCLRTDDIDEVGDVNHHTFFEMLGNWSLGDYFKKESISWSYEFLTKILKLDPGRLYITCFAGDQDAPKDEESASIWQTCGIPKERIFFLPKKDNWWGPAGTTGPCGPDTEMHYDLTQKACGSNCHPGGCSCGRFSEIWNNVFMEYNKDNTGKFVKLAKPSVDTGMGLERTLSVLNKLSDDYLNDLWQPLIQSIAAITNQDYVAHQREFRIIADHFRAAVFLASDGIEPSNKERGYVLRRLIRRAALQFSRLGIKNLTDSSLTLCSIIIQTMSDPYYELVENSSTINSVIETEINRFSQTLEKGLREFYKLNSITGKSAFDLFQTYGFPWELTYELAKENNAEISQAEFAQEFKKHQDLSRSASAGMFKGGLADHSEVTTKYHTATHLLHAALRQILGNHVQQKGSNITADRLRFDFSHPEKLTQEQLDQIESIINAKIMAQLPVVKEELSKTEALASGALAFFGQKYPDIVTVYTIGDKTNWFSKELCGGPHVTNTREIGKIKLVKQEAVGSNTRRLYLQLA